MSSILGEGLLNVFISVTMAIGWIARCRSMDVGIMLADGTSVIDTLPAHSSGGRSMASTQVVKYRADDGTVVTFEIDPVEGFSPASADSAVVGQVRDAAGPAIQAAKSVLERVKELSPDSIQVKFGIKVSGTANWLMAKSTAEGSFEVTLSWDRSAALGADTAAEAGHQPVLPRIGD